MEQECSRRIEEITERFKQCRKALLAMGDETRQGILLTLLQSDMNGVRVGELTAKTHLARPSVSHHLKVLREAEIVNVRREGTKNYYYLDSNESRWGALAELVGLVYEGIRHIGPDDPRRGEDFLNIP